MGNLNFDSTSVESMGSFEVLPSGEYTAVIFESEVKVNSKKTGDYLKLVFQIIDGPYQGRNLWKYLNIVHENKKAENIAKSELANICRAIGVPKPNESRELHDKPMLIHVDIESRSDTGEPTNRIVGYSSKGSIPAPRMPGISSPRPTPTKTATPAWKQPKPSVPEDKVPF